MSKEEIKENNLNITEMQLKMEQTISKLERTLSTGVYIIPKPAKALKIISNSGKTSNTTRQEAIFEIPNPFKEDVQIKEIALFPDTTFQGNGTLFITVNDVELYTFLNKNFLISSTGETLTFDEGLSLHRDESIKFFFYNDNGTEIQLRARVKFVVL